MYTRLKNLFAIKGYSLFVICLLLIGIGFSITAPYLSLYCTEDIGKSAGAFGVFMAVSSLSGVVVNSLIAKRSDSGLHRKWIIISATLSSALGYASYLVFHNFFILLIVVSLFNERVHHWKLGNLGGGIIAQFAGFRHVYWVSLTIVIFSFFILWRTRPHEEMEVPTGHTRSV